MTNYTAFLDELVKIAAELPQSPLYSGSHLPPPTPVGQPTLKPDKGFFAAGKTGTSAPPQTPKPQPQAPAPKPSPQAQPQAQPQAPKPQAPKPQVPASQASPKGWARVSKVLRKHKAGLIGAGVIGAGASALGYMNRRSK